MTGAIPATVAEAGAATTASAAEVPRVAGHPDPGVAGARLSDLFSRHGATVLGLCRMLLRNADEAEDAVQQTFLAAYRSLLSGIEPRHPAAWLATIARNECWALISRRMHEPVTETEPVSTLPDPVAAAASRADLAELWRAIGELPRQQRQALLLREFSGLSYDELAEALAVSEPAVESLLFRARRQLRVRLRPMESTAAGVAPLAAIREALARAIGGMPDPSSVGLLAKVASAPLVAKLAAAAVAVVVTGGTVAVVNSGGVPQPQGPAPAAASITPAATVDPAVRSAAARPAGVRRHVALPRSMKRSSPAPLQTSAAVAASSRPAAQSSLGAGTSETPSGASERTPEVSPVPPDAEAPTSQGDTPPTDGDQPATADEGHGSGSGSDGSGVSGGSGGDGSGDDVSSVNLGSSSEGSESSGSGVGGDDNSSQDGGGGSGSGSSAGSGSAGGSDSGSSGGGDSGSSGGADSGSRDGGGGDDGGDGGGGG